MEIKIKVDNLLKKLKSFDEVVNVLDKIPAENGGATIRGYILDYMEKNYPEEFECWL